MSKKCLSMFIICILLAAGLLGCGGKESPVSSEQGSKQGPSKTYRESEIKLDKLQMVMNLALDSQDRLVMYDDEDRDSKFVILDKQGREIKQIPCPGDAHQNSYNNGRIFALDSRGRIYQLQQISVYDKPQSEEPRELIKRLQIYSPGGQIEKTIELGSMTGENSLNQMDRAVAVDAKGRIYILHQDGKIEVIEENGQSLKTIRGDKYYEMDIDKQGNLMVTGRDTEGNFLAEISTSGKVIWKRTLENIKMAVLSYKYNIHDECSYIADYSGIKKYDPRGNFVEEVLNYRDTSIFVSDAFVNSIAFDAQSNIYISIMYNGASESGRQFSVYKYIPDKAAAKPQGPQKTLSIAVASGDPLMMEKAARLFGKKHPGVVVEVKDYSGRSHHGDRDDYEDYIKNINTEILSGKGPDIISTEGLPYRKYAEKDVFLDLKSLMNQDKSFKRQDYYANILKSCESQGKLYAMPVSFWIPVMVADGAMLQKAGVSIDDSRWVWSDFYDAAKKICQDSNNDGKLETYVLPKLRNDRMLDYMLASEYRNFVNEDKKKAHLDSPAFIRFLNTYKDLTGKYTNNKVDEEELIFSGNRSSIAFFPYDSFGGDLTMERSAMGSQTRILAMPHGSGLGDRPFDAEMYAINSNSKLRKEAWEFLKFITSKEQQISLNFYGVHINRLAQDHFFAEAAKQKSSCVTFGNEEHVKTVDVEPLTPEQIKQNRQLIAALNHCHTIDPQIKKIMGTEIAVFVRGERSAAQTAKILQNKVTLYLNE